MILRIVALVLAVGLLAGCAVTQVHKQTTRPCQNPPCNRL